MDRMKLMETFESIVRLGGFAAAAKELGVSRAMISRRILELEGTLSAKLLNRTTQRLSVTEAGAEYFKTCTSVLDQVRTAEERLKSRGKEPSGELRILCSKTFGELILAPILGRFCVEHPAVRPKVVLRDLGTDEHDLISRGFDLAIRPQQIESTSLVARPVVPLPRVIVASPTYLAKRGVPLTPDDLRQHSCLSPNGDDHHTWKFENRGAVTSVRVVGTFSAASSTVIRHAALSGVGIALVGAYVVDDDIKAGRLIHILDEYKLPKRMLYVVYQKDRFQPLRTRLFIRFLTDAMRSRVQL